MANRTKINRKDAKALNLTRYFTGKPCKHGHVAERIVTNWDCIVCARQRGMARKEENCQYNKNWRKNNAGHLKQYRQDNSEHNKVRNKKYREENKEDLTVKRRKYYEENKEHIKNKTQEYYQRNKRHISEMGKIWNKNNPEKCAKYARFYLQHREGATPLWYETDLIKQLYIKRDELSELWGIDLHVDHIIPLQGKNVCGLHCWDNLQLLEDSLNMSKSNKY